MSLHKQFKPNLTPKKMFEMGSFGGTYWRPIYSSITNKKYKYVGVIWKYIETFEPKIIEPKTIKLKPLENNYWKNYNNKYGGGGRYGGGKY